MHVIIVDEEYYFAENVAAILRIEGHHCTILSNASDALAYFGPNSINSQPMQLLIDVALAPGENKKVFTAEITQEYLTTGIVLVDELLRQRLIDPTAVRVTLYTAHLTGQLWAKITRFCGDRNLRHWQKRADATDEEIVSLIAG